MWRPARNAFSLSPLSLVSLGLLTACAGSPAHSPALAPPAPAPPAIAPAPTVATAPSAAPSSELAAKIDPIFASYSTSAPTPGCAVGVYRAGAVVYAKGYGHSNLEHDAHNTEATPFYLASVSKQFTAAAVLLLAQDGKVSLEDDVRKYIPELPSYGAGAPITLAQLLHHTSGVRDYGLLLTLQGSEDADHVTNDDVLWLLAHQRALNFPTGSRFLYSNSGYVLLSLVVERVSKKPFSAFVKERIFDPLGMADTFVKDDSTRITPGRAIGYEPRPDKTFATSLSDSEYTGPGNVVSSVRDLAKWDANFYTPKVGGASLIESMRVRGKLTDGSQTDYAMGLEEGQTHGLAREEHNGGFVGYRTVIVRYPSERLTVTVLCNDASAQPGDLAEKVATIFLPQLGKPEEPAVAAPKATPGALGVEPAALAGTYLNESTLEVRVLDSKDGVIHLRFSPEPGGDQRELVPVGPRDLWVKDGTTHYVFEPAKGKLPARLLRKSEAGPTDTYVRVEPIPTGSVTPAKLADYAGRYGSDEIARDVELFVEDGKLRERTWGRAAAPAPLAPIARDVFGIGDVRCRFERNGGGRVTGMTVGAGRTSGVKLVKRAK